MSATIDEVKITRCDQTGLDLYADVTFPQDAMNQQVFAEIGVINNGQFEKVLQSTYSLEDGDGDGRWTGLGIESPCFYGTGKDIVAKAWATYMMPQESLPGQSTEFDCDCAGGPGGP